MHQQTSKVTGLTYWNAVMKMLKPIIKCIQCLLHNKLVTKTVNKTIIDNNYLLRLAHNE